MTDGHHRYPVGRLEVIVVSDGFRTFPLQDGFILNAGRDAINAALAAAGMPADVMTIHFNPVAVVSGSQIILLDTGNGQAAAAQPGATLGHLSANLAGAGIAADAVDIVVISHFHGDHINGLLDAEGAPAFPRARILVPEREWAFATDAALRAAAPAGRMRDMFENVARVFEPLAGRVDRFEWDSQIAEGVKAVGTPGHTVGHTSFLLESGGEKVFVQSDVTNHPALFVRNPHWHAAFDLDPVEAEATRQRVYDMLADEDMPVQGFHYPFPARGRVRKDGSGYIVTPIENR